jgi:hypothetical protein
MGLDPGAGGDNSAIAIRQGPKILKIIRFNTADPQDFATRVIKVWHQYEPVIINIDSIGIGWGVTGLLRAQGYRVETVDVRRTARNRDIYDSRRDELWGTLKEHFEKGTISIPNDQELIDQLGSIKIKDYVKGGKIKMPSKKDMRKSDSVGGSPDEADAICLTYAVDDALLRKIYLEDYDEDEERKYRQRNIKRNRVTGY